jgi:biotin transport system substrate-specific component
MVETRNNVVLRPRVLVDTLPASALQDAALVATYAALVGLFAQLVIRLTSTPVPITGQTFGVLLVAMALGSRRAVAGVAVYLGVRPPLAT